MVKRNVLRGSCKWKFGASVEVAARKLKSPADPGGNMLRVIGLGEVTIVFRISGL